MAALSNQRPTWFGALLSQKFFAPCDAHSGSKKNERNIFCLDCTLSICQHCLPQHHSLHRILQICRYVYHDVIRIEDIQKLVDCSLVQPYIINSAKVVFLNQRPQPRPLKVPSSLCHNCQRGLQESYRYCSIGCKVEAVLRQGEEGLQMLFLSWSDDSMQVSSDLLDCTNSSCLTSQEHENMRISIGSKAVSTEQELDEEDEREQCSPNSVLGEQLTLNSSTPTSSGSADELLPWRRIHSDGRESKMPRASLPMSRSISMLTKKRRKSRPHRAPVS